MADTVLSSADALGRGATTATALVEASLSAIAAQNPRTNAFITVDAAGAREAARTLDRDRTHGGERGPLHGIPLSLKDLIDQAGLVTTAGSRVLADRVAPADAPIVTRLQRAGAVVIGRTNLHEFALGTTSEDSAYGAVRNPADPSRSAGGSSGGSAAAVAAGMGLLSVGTDTGGSVRIPAAACGVVGLKPSFGEISTDGIIPLSTSLDHVGPLAQTVQDVGWTYAVLAGRAPTVIRARGLDTLRLKRLTGYFDTPLDPYVRRVLERALDQLVGAGVRLTRAEIAGTETISETYVNIVLPEAAHWHAPYLDAHREAYTPAVHARIQHGRSIPAVSYLAARDACLILRREVDAALDEVDALVLPTLPIVAPLLGTTEIVVDPTSGLSMPVRAAMLKHTQLFNLTGHPAISLPMAADGLPVGLQLVGRLGHTADLLAVAAACEAVVSPSR